MRSSYPGVAVFTIASVLLSFSGCGNEYLVEPDRLLAAQRVAVQSPGGDARGPQIEVFPAWADSQPAQAKPVSVRLWDLRVEDAPQSARYWRVAVGRSSEYVTAGGIGIGLGFLVASGVTAGLFLEPGCRGEACFGGQLMTLIVSLPLGVLGLAGVGTGAGLIGYGRRKPMSFGPGVAVGQR